MRRLFKNAVPILISLFIVIIFNSLLKYKNAPVNKSGNTQDTLGEAPISGLGFSVKYSDNFVDSIDMNKIKDYKLILSNSTSERRLFSLTILAGYKQQTFKYENKNTDICSLSIEPNSELVLPIKLNENDNNNISNYTFTFIPSPNESVSNVKIKDMAKYKDLTFIIPVINSNGKMHVGINHENKEVFPLDGLNIIPYANRKELESKSFRPNYEIKIKKYENSLNIPIVIGGGDCNDYLIYCLINGKQALINGEYALRYSIEAKNAMIDNIKVNIDNSIKNEVIFFIIPNPEKIEQDKDIESSYRFTIVGE